MRTSYWAIALAYLLVGHRVGLAGTPASAFADRVRAGAPGRNGLGYRGPATRPRWRGDAIHPRVLLTVGYGTAIASAVANSPDSAKVTDTLETQLQKSYAGAEAAAQQYPQYSDAIVAAAKMPSTGANWAYAAGIMAILVGRRSPGGAIRTRPRSAMLAEYERQDEPAKVP